MRKKILIDASTVTSQVDGLSHCIINLIKYLPEESFNYFEYTVLVNKGLQRKALTDLLDGNRIRVIEAKVAPIGPKRDWDMFWFLRKYRKQFDLIHITSNNYPFSLKNGICTIHDITFKRYFDNPPFTFKLAPFYMDRVIRHAIKNTKAIITVSQSTKDDVVNTFRVSKDNSKKFVPVRLGWEHLQNELGAETQQCEQELPPPRSYLLYVGNNRVHKNISNLLLSFRDAIPFIPQEKKLAIIGSDKHLKEIDKQIIAEINSNEHRVIFTGYLSQACVEAYFKNADAYIFPSFSEGFGLGVLEAFYYRIPLLCSNTTSLPEVAGEAALYFDPFNPAEITSAIRRFYDDPSLANKLVALGDERLKHFSWKKNAAQTIDVYRKCLDVPGVATIDTLVEQNELAGIHQMRILHLIFTNGVAGAEKYLQHLLIPLRKKGFDCHLMLVCSPGFESSLEEYCKDSQLSGIPTRLLVSTRHDIISTAKKVSGYMKQYDIHHIHSHLLKSDILATVVKLFYHRSTVIISTKHGYHEGILSLLSDDIDKAGLRRRAKKDAYYYVSRFVIKYSDFNYAVSRSAAQLYTDLHLLSPVMPHIHHGVDIAPIPKSTSNNEHRVCSPQLITVGRLEEVKGTRYLLEAMPAVIEKFPDVCLLLIGSGADKTKLEQLAEKLNITKHVRFLGFTKHPYTYVANSDVVILPSLFETFGLVFIEAFALKTPVVAFDTPAGNEIMENEVTALLVKPKDVKTLSEKIIFLLENPEYAAAMTERAYNKYVENYSAKRMVDETATFYKQISRS